MNSYLCALLTAWLAAVCRIAELHLPPSAPVYGYLQAPSSHDLPRSRAACHELDNTLLIQHDARYHEKLSWAL